VAREPLKNNVKISHTRDYCKYVLCRRENVKYFSTMKNKRLCQTAFGRPTEYSKPSKNGLEAMNGNGVPKSVDKLNGKRSVNGDKEDKSPRKKIKKNDSPKATASSVNSNSVSKESSRKSDISHLFSDHSRLLPGSERQTMTKTYSTSTP
jgi:hypothetical protein